MFAMYNDMQSHTGAMLAFGKEAVFFLDPDDSIIKKLGAQSLVILQDNTSSIRLDVNGKDLAQRELVILI